MPSPPRQRVVRDTHPGLLPWLLLWAIAGALGLCLLPGLRGNALSGLTLPFWLVGAPLLDVAWLTRARWLSALRGRAGSRRSRRPRVAR
jgi:hypothetical protein